MCALSKPFLSFCHNIFVCTTMFWWVRPFFFYLSFCVCFGLITFFFGALVDLVGNYSPQVAYISITSTNNNLSSNNITYGTVARRRKSFVNIYQMSRIPKQTQCPKKDEIPHMKEISLSQIYDADMQQLQTSMELHLMKI